MNPFGLQPAGALFLYDGKYTKIWDLREIYVDMRFSEFGNSEFTTDKKEAIFLLNSEFPNSTLLNSEFPNSDKSHICENSIQIPYSSTYQTQIPYRK